jgi:hypothetical protein
MPLYGVQAKLADQMRVWINKPAIQYNLPQHLVKIAR